jgi:sialic acid synthase SpsE
MSVKIVFDPGSTHMGDRKKAKELIDVAARAGADAIKFQMFPATNEQKAAGNIALPYDWFGELWKYGRSKKIPVTASVWDKQGIEILNYHKVMFIKFSYSQQNQLSYIQGLLNTGKTVVVSTDVMKLYALPTHKNIVPMFCQPVYPTMTKTNFDDLFPPFQGFSDHSLGTTEAVQAVKHGATWIEKHITLNYTDCLDTPDGKFALLPDQAKKLVKDIRAVESGSDEGEESESTSNRW